MNTPAAIYARVSSDRQSENHTIVNQTAALLAHESAHGYAVPPEWVFEHAGYSGAVLARPGLEALRDRRRKDKLVPCWSTRQTPRAGSIPTRFSRGVIAFWCRTGLLGISGWGNDEKTAKPRKCLL